MPPTAAQLANLRPFRTREAAQAGHAKSVIARQAKTAAKKLDSLAHGNLGANRIATHTAIVAHDTAQRLANLEARLTNNGKGGRPRKDGRPTGSGPLPRHRADNPLDDLPPPTLAKPTGNTTP